MFLKMDLVHAKWGGTGGNFIESRACAGDSTTRFQTAWNKRAAIATRPREHSLIPECGRGGNSLKIFYFTSAARRSTIEDFRDNAEALFIGVRDCFAKSRAGALAEQVDGTSAEAAAGHSRPQYASGSDSYIDEKIEFRAADFIIVLQADMRFDHQLAHAFDVAAPGGFDEQLQAVVFGDDMPGAPHNDLGHRRSGPLEHGDGHVAQAAYAGVEFADGLHGSRALLGAFLICGVRQRVFDHGIDRKNFDAV